MSSTLGYAPLDGTTVKSRDNYYEIDGPDKIMHKYLLLLESYKHQIIAAEPSEDSNELSILDVKFLENVLKIKTRIAKLNEEHSHIVGQIFEIDKEIAELEKIKKSYIDIVIVVDKYIKNYSGHSMNPQIVEKVKQDYAINETLSKDNKLNVITTILEEKKPLFEKYVEQKEKIMNEIKVLKNIICTSCDTLQKEENTLMCFICRDNPIDCCLNPCGHTCCNNCASRLANQQCYICRTRFTSKTKMFFDNGEVMY